MVPAWVWMAALARACMTRLEQCWRSRPAQPRQWFLDDSELTAKDLHAWQVFLAAAAKALGLQVQIELFRGLPPEDGAGFAFVSSAAALSRKLLWNLPRLYVAPRAAPTQLDRWLQAQLTPQELALCTPSEVGEPPPSASVLTSVFRGDEFLAGFLRNCSQWQGYAQVEHFLIRPNSPGQEHAALVAHVHTWPCAIYIFLPKDPGLYAVWNLGAQLSTRQFLSNANLDDRRSPEHLAKMIEVLRAKPEISAVAAALHVSQTPNLDWGEAAACPTMFGAVAGGIYNGKDLFKNQNDQWVSHNFLHCMPVWRRSLHARFGYFDEGRYGPSADWAFWLACAAGGANFGFVDKALGVYLRDPRSYWRRNPRAMSADRLIAQQYAWMAEAKALDCSFAWRPAYPLSRQLEQAFFLLEIGAVLEGLSLLMQVVSNPESNAAGAEALVMHWCQRYLDSADLRLGLPMYKALQAPGDAAVINQLVVQLANLLHCYHQKGQKITPRAGRLLVWAGFDLLEWGQKTSAQLLLALLNGIQEKKQAESELLHKAFAEDDGGFWLNIQSIYRFSRSLDDICKIIGKKIDKKNHHLRKRIIYYPDFQQNTYLQLLYAANIEQGDVVAGFKDIGEVLSQKIMPGYENILHIHWIQKLPIDENLGILSSLDKFKKSGFQLHWTIHNKLSHDCRNKDLEIKFRRSLYELCDCVYVHHPLASKLIDWLPNTDKINIHEHGPNIIPEITYSDLSEFKKHLELDGKFVVTIIGQMRDYKGLGDIFPTLLDLLKCKENVKIILAGRQSSDKLKKWLSENPHPRLMVVDRFLDEKELGLYMKSADVGLIPYREVLTSGSLFHWFSVGRLVVAPDKGLIPGHLVDGWNGRLFSGAQHLVQVIKQLSSMTFEEREVLHANSFLTGQKLQWKPF